MCPAIIRSLHRCSNRYKSGLWQDNLSTVRQRLVLMPLQYCHVVYRVFLDFMVWFCLCSVNCGNFLNYAHSLSMCVHSQILQLDQVFSFTGCHKRWQTYTTMTALSFSACSIFTWSPISMKFIVYVPGDVWLAHLVQSLNIQWGLSFEAAPDSLYVSEVALYIVTSAKWSLTWRETTKVSSGSSANLAQMDYVFEMLFLRQTKKKMTIINVGMHVYMFLFIFLGF